jgi:hypothetical protein
MAPHNRKGEHRRGSHARHEAARMSRIGVIAGTGYAGAAGASGSPCVGSIPLAASTSMTFCLVE